MTPSMGTECSEMPGFGLASNPKDTRPVRPQWGSKAKNGLSHAPLTNVRIERVNTRCTGHCLEKLRMIEKKTICSRSFSVVSLSSIKSRAVQNVSNLQQQQPHPCHDPKVPPNLSTPAFNPQNRSPVATFSPNVYSDLCTNM